MKIALVAFGDPRRASTWSGVPFCLYCQFKEMGHEVVPLDLTSDSLWHWIGVGFNRVLRLVPKWNRVAFCNTKFGLWLSRCWLMRKTRQFGPFDLLFSTSFSVDFRGVDCPIVLLHDWTEGYAILRSGKRLNSAERASEENQLSLLRQADIVVALYPKSCEYILGHCTDVASKIKFICSPVNSAPLSRDDVKKRFAKVGKHILVVGGSAYQDNVECVIKAADELRDDEIVVDVIGRERAKTIPRSCKVNFYGYLRKDDSQQLSLYKSLFLHARCLVNTQKNWGGGSSIAEAMFNYVPVIVGRYPDIQAMYGEAKDRFGYYCQEGDVAELSKKIRDIMDMDEEHYYNLCVSAHNVCRNDTYEFLVKTILADLKKQDVKSRVPQGEMIVK